MFPVNDYKFYMRRVTQDSEGNDIFGTITDIEEYFPGLRYKAITGMEAYGKPYTYSEAFSDSDKTAVYVPSDACNEPTTIKLTLYFFDKNEHSDLPSAITAIDAQYHAFVEFILGARILYWDDVRQRKALLYVTDKIEPTTDRVSDNFYREVTITFTNVYGRTFGMSQMTEELPTG